MRQPRLDPRCGHSCAHSPGRMGHTLYPRHLGSIRFARSTTIAERESHIHEFRPMRSTRSQLRVACRHFWRRLKTPGPVTHMLIVRFLQVQSPQRSRRAAAKANQINDSGGAGTHAPADWRSQRLRPCGQIVNVLVQAQPHPPAGQATFRPTQEAAHSHPHACQRRRRRQLQPTSQAH
jgi:hypothetical protein